MLFKQYGGPELSPVRFSARPAVVEGVPLYGWGWGAGVSIKMRPTSFLSGGERGKRGDDRLNESTQKQIKAEERKRK